MKKAPSSVREHWRRIIDQQRHSGLSVACFCRNRQIPESSLFAWKRRLAREAQVAAAPAFVLVKPTVALASENTLEPAGGAIELHLGSGRHIVLRPGFDSATLAAVLAVLASQASRPEVP